MYLVAIAWIYVVLMMAVAEATSSQGTVLGAFFTFVLYGALPLSIVMYVLRTPHRRRTRRAREAAELEDVDENEEKKAG
jgi:mannose/fructose/N-acetylgalactosamine-specific phosphotransferase system component IID